MGFISWFFLCSAIAVFNSYYDKDTKPVAGLENPPVATSSLLVGALLLKLFGLIIALFLNKLFLLMYIIGILISVLYSHKNFRFKSNGYVAVLINFIVGTITFIAASSFVHLNTQLLLLGSITAGIFLAAIYLMMQIHQKEEDIERQDISIMVSHGRKTTLISAIILMFMASILSSITLKFSGVSWFYISIIIIYFFVILFSSYKWLKNQENPTSDFKIMNKLTMRLSYSANLILLIIYIFDVIN